MAKLNELHTYENILVSGVEYDFSSNRHERVPRQLYADWASLIVKLAKAVCPAFDVPPLPESLFFQTETIPSDGPYSANPDYYMLDYVFFELKAENGCGLKISFENGRWGGDNPVSMETVGFDRGISSHIYKDAKSPRANVYLWHGVEKSSEIAEIIARHQKAFRPSFRKWKTARDTFLIERELIKIPYINGGVGLKEGERFDDSSEYVEATASGEVVKRYGKPQPFSLDDEMTVSNIHRVIGDCYYEFYYSHYVRSEPQVSAKLLLSELEFYEDILPFDEGKLFDEC